MSLVNPELESKITEITKKICDPNCKKCKVSLVKNLENRVRLSNLNKKRNLKESNDDECYYDAIEYNSEYLPKKYRKYTYEQHRTSQFLERKPSESQQSFKFDDEKLFSKEEETELDSDQPDNKLSDEFENYRKRKADDTQFEKDAELYLENVKRRVLESKESKKSDSDNKVEDLEYEKFKEERYYGLLKNVDKSTLVEFVDLQPKSSFVKDTVTTGYSSQKLFGVDTSSPQKIELSPTPEMVTSVSLDTPSEPSSVVTHSLESPEKLKEDTQPKESTKSTQPRETKETSEKLSSKGITFVPTPLETPKESEDKLETPKPPELTSIVSETKTITNLFGTTNESTVKNLFSTDYKSTPGSDKSKELFSSLDKIKVDKPVGNPLFAPNRQTSSEFVPKTDGANYVFGQSRPQPEKPSGLGGQLPFGGFQPQQTFQDTSLYNQLASSGYGTPLVQQQNPTIFGPGSFKKTKFRGRGRGRH